MVVEQRTCPSGEWRKRSTGSSGMGGSWPPAPGRFDFQDEVLQKHLLRRARPGGQRRIHLATTNRLLATDVDVASPLVAERDGHPHVGPGHARQHERRPVPGDGRRGVLGR